MAKAVKGPFSGIELEYDYREIVEEQADLICRFRSDGTLALANEAFVRYFGLSRDSLQQYKFPELFSVTDRELLAHHLEGINKKNPIGACDLSAKAATGEIQWHQWVYNGILDSLGDVVEYQAVGREVTQRKRVEEILGITQFSMDCAADSVFRINPAGHFLYVNDAVCRLVEYSCEELLSMGIMDIDPSFNEANWQQFWGEIKLRTSLTIETAYRTSTGKTLPVEMAFNYFQYNGKEFCCAFGRDITERKQSEAKIREQATLLDKARDAIMVMDLNFRVVYWNRSAELLYGWTAREAMGKDPIHLLIKKDSPKIPEIRSKILDDGEWTGELEQITKGTDPITVHSRWTVVRDDDGNLRRIIAWNTDLKKVKELEKQLLRAQRMESLGTLAAGIAHDLNNVLAPILMAVQLLRETLQNEASRPILSILETSGQRAANIVKQLLTFGRGLEGERGILQPKHLIREMMRIAEETFSKSIHIEKELPRDLWTVLGDTTQLHQVLLNLCINARDAMPQGGTLILKAENIQLDDTFARMFPESKEGNYVMITVADTGDGIDPKIMDKIFDPFFTTKKQGTGLGLSTVMGIVKSHNGFIRLSSQVGRGTQFQIYLPASDSQAGPTQPSEPPKVKPLYRGQGELILVVEDEEPVRQIMRRALEKNGYRVLTAPDGTEAIALYVQNQSEIKLVLTDMVMPIMGGVATIRALNKINASVPIVATSGTLTDKTDAEALGQRVCAFLPKPFSAEKLLDVIWHGLHGENPPETLV